MKMQLFLLISFLVLVVNPSFSQQNAAVKVTMTDDQDFAPNEVRVTAGETVVWENTTPNVHTVTFDPDKALDKSHGQVPEGVQPFGSDRLEPGDTYSYTFTKAGTYHYFCSLHESSGMFGQVVVEASSESNHSGHSHQNQSVEGGNVSSEDQHQGDEQNQHEHATGQHADEYASYEKGIGEAAKFKEFPNLHPMIVHFPVVLLMLAAAAQVLAFIKYKKEFSWAVLLLLAGGFVSGLLAANLWHPMVASDAPEEIRRIFEEHESFAFTTLWLSGIALGFKLLSLIIKLKVWAEVIVLLLLIGAAGIVGYTGHLGSQMVYIENVGPQERHLEGHSH